VIEGRDLLGQAQRMAQRQHLDGNADLQATRPRSNGAGNDEGRGDNRSLRQEVQFREPDHVETPALGRVDLGKGLSECLGIGLPCVTRELVENTELERHGLPQNYARESVPTRLRIVGDSVSRPRMRRGVQRHRGRLRRLRSGKG
jgi:hypothetical protein